jgi:hypothetical protein
MEYSSLIMSPNQSKRCDVRSSVVLKRKQSTFFFRGALFACDLSAS